MILADGPVEDGKAALSISHRYRAPVKYNGRNRNVPISPITGSAPPARNSAGTGPVPRPLPSPSAACCDAKVDLPDIVFPQANPTVKLAERTFWEKANAIHVCCRQGRRRGKRLSRRWYNLARLDEAGIAASTPGRPRARAFGCLPQGHVLFGERCPNRVDRL